MEVELSRRAWKHDGPLQLLNHLERHPRSCLVSELPILDDREKIALTVGKHVTKMATRPITRVTNAGLRVIMVYSFRPLHLQFPVRIRSEECKNWLPDLVIEAADKEKSVAFVCGK